MAHDEVDELAKQAEESNELIGKMELSLDERDLRISDQQRVVAEERKATDECIQSKNREIELAHIE